MLYPQSNQFREMLVLDGFWSFKADPDDRGIEEKWFADPLQNAETVATGAAFNEQLPHHLNHLGTVWYQKTVFVPEDWSEKWVMARFGCANWNVDVWLNGQSLGSHSGGYISFELSCGKLLRPGGENTLTVRVDMKLSRETVLQDGRSIGHWWGYGDKYPPCSGDYFPWGGLQRPVILYATGQEYIADIIVNTKTDGTTGLVDYEVEVAGGGEVEVEIDNVSAQGKTGQLAIENARLWSPESPKRYRLEVTLTGEDGLPVDRYELMIGIRTVEVSGRHVLVNGKPYYFQGLGRHEDFHVIGSGVSLPLLVRDFALLKWLGVNSLRAGHYPPSDELLEAADRLGMFIFDEVPANAFYHGRTSGGDTLEDLVPPAFRENHKQAIREMVARDRNHPSVVAWSVANEPNSTTEICGHYLREIYEFTKGLDDRPVIFTSCGGLDDKAQGFFDIVCLNIYYFVDRAGGSWDAVRSMVSTLCDRMFERHGKPILATEFGADALAGEHSLPPVLLTEEFQRDHVINYLDVLESKEFICGSLIWCFADFRVPQHFGRQIYNRKGLFTRDRQPKLLAHLLKERWAKPVRERSDWKDTGLEEVYIKRSEEDWQ
ncbi:MAG: glycoside hydrolase family 2 TIM barrel-domain containing protein [Gemmatimonadota bacterium]|nr:glycoside hydrolase family 2 TIM barrel-domain containing protein [Gemmatimonadota bacterium]